MPSATQTPIPLPPKLMRRFYEAVKFEEALSKACEQDPISLGKTSTDPPVDPSDDAEKAYKSYVNKLAHVCDTKRGGSTVTGIAILQDVDGVVYVIGSNDRTSTDLTELSKFVRSLFDLVQNPFTRIFHHIIEHNQPRIRTYLNCLTKEIEICLESMKDQARRTVNQEHLKESLIELQNCVAHAQRAIHEQIEERINACADVIMYIHDIQTKGHGEDMFLASREATINPSKPWRQLRHSMARLKAYHVSTHSIISAHRCWPQLFDGARIIAVPSSTSYPNPLKKNKMATAHDMLGRMVPPEEVELRRADAQTMQRFGLDKILLEACGQKTFTPLVHGEVLVHDFVRAQLLEDENLTYWNNWRYVGSSKPTCRLCAYYFSQITDVMVRESHGNLYAKWRAPDVHDAGGARQREKILNSIVTLIRQDALRTLASKLPRGKPDDSSSFPTVELYFTQKAHRAMAEDGVASIPSGHPLIGAVGIRHAASDDLFLADMLSRQSLEQSQSQDDDDSDEEDGGVML
ncbi:hypothetical protein Micbo1qcDRAFT_196887 [Microdochium bolleyi]|uniref:Uncharacterized protein n=1 Tax=Microdochium bolleyi TaxID=196109 RepID=A0A136IVN8_9PEZI|nr:hypothetical protein Micbo1qcDRAFT_196887 [Microdochium bolleyi]